MKVKVIIGVFAIGLLISCGGSSTKDELTNTNQAAVLEEPAVETGSVSVDPMEDKGVGPITAVEVGEIDHALVEKGQEVFDANCTACHKMGKRFVGPDLVGITNRRTPEWIMNMILDPELMVKENQAAKALLMEYSAPMANQSLEEDQARAIFEYLRTVESI